MQHHAPTYAMLARALLLSSTAAHFCHNTLLAQQVHSMLTGTNTHTCSAMHRRTLCWLVPCCFLQSTACHAVPVPPGGSLALFRAVPARAGGVSRAHVEALQQHCRQQRGSYLANLQSLLTCRDTSLSETPRRFAHLQPPQLHNYWCEDASQCADSELTCTAPGTQACVKVLLPLVIVSAGQLTDKLELCLHVLHAHESATMQLIQTAAENI